MPTIFDPGARGALLRRIDALQPDRPALWGRMTAPQMVAHLNCALRAALGELEVGPPRGPLSSPPLNWLAIHLLPWPKAKAVSPAEFLATPPATWKEDVGAFHALLERNAARGADAAWPLSPVFGRISGRSWGVLHHKHVDHHLRQFGV